MEEDLFDRLNPADYKPYPPNRFVDIPDEREDFIPRNTQEAELNSEVQSRINDIKNRIELKKMFAEYEAGSLKPPVYFKGNVFDDDEGLPEDTPFGDDYTEPILRLGMKRTNAEVDTAEDEVPEPQLKKTAFREKAREDPGEYVHLRQNHASFTDDNINELPSEGGGVYTEGGLVFVPSGDNSNDGKFG